MKRWIVMAVSVTAIAFLCVVPTVLWVTGRIKMRQTSEPAGRFRLTFDVRRLFAFMSSHRILSEISSAAKRYAMKPTDQGRFLSKGRRLAGQDQECRLEGVFRVGFL